MFCPNCGDPVDTNEKFCNKCGNKLELTTDTQSVNNYTHDTNQYNNLPNTYNQSDFIQGANNENQDRKMILIGVCSGIGVLLFAVVCIMLFGKSSYYFSNQVYGDNNEIVNNNASSTQNKKSKYSTIIITDNTYFGVKINSENDANKLIEDDSIKQKASCPKEIKQIENNIISKYGVTAVNLCELDINFAKELDNLFSKIYAEYPSVKGNLTNLSLINASMSEGYIAAFLPAFVFATSNKKSGYPNVIKTQIFLNTSYFLNKERLQSSVNDGANSGHFPPNATMYSPVAHELGHYLSFLSAMRKYDMDSVLLIDNSNLDMFYKVIQDFGIGKHSFSMIEEAYNNYKNDTSTTLTIDEWRGTISQYALAKDNSGEYIYDETIAEAFHDVYLNGNNATDASKYVVNVLKQTLEG